MLPQGGQLGGKSGLDGVKARHQAAAMLGHVGEYARFVLEEADMAQLVHLVIADDHDREAPADISQRFFTACQGRNTSAGEGDLAGRGEHEDAVLSAVLLALVQQDGGRR